MLFLKDIFFSFIPGKTKITAHLPEQKEKRINKGGAAKIQSVFYRLVIVSIILLIFFLYKNTLKYILKE